MCGSHRKLATADDGWVDVEGHAIHDAVVRRQQPRDLPPPALRPHRGTLLQHDSLAWHRQRTSERSLHQYQSFWLGWNLIGRAVWPWHAHHRKRCNTYRCFAAARAPWGLLLCLQPTELCLLEHEGQPFAAAACWQPVSWLPAAGAARCCQHRPESGTQPGEATTLQCHAGPPGSRSQLKPLAAGRATMAEASRSHAAAYERCPATAATAPPLAAAEHPATWTDPALTCRRVPSVQAPSFACPSSTLCSRYHGDREHPTSYCKMLGN